MTASTGGPAITRSVQGRPRRMRRGGGAIAGGAATSETDPASERQEQDDEEGSYAYPLVAREQQQQPQQQQERSSSSTSLRRRAQQQHLADTSDEITEQRRRTISDNSNSNNNNILLYTNDSNDFAGGAEGGGNAGIAVAESRFVEGGAYLDEYSCTRAAGEVKLESLEVQYDYEYVAEDGNAAEIRGSHGRFRSDERDDLPPTLPAVEWGTLWTSANLMGLHGCHFDVQSIPPSSSSTSSSSISRQQQQQQKDDGGTRRKLNPIDGSLFVVSLSSSPVDGYDPTAASCEHLLPEKLDELCYPMRGKMTVTYVGNDPVAIQNYALKHIAQVLDDHMALTKGVKSTLYLGNRAEYQSPHVDGVESAPKALSPTDSSYVAITASVTFVAVLTLIVTGLLLVRRGKKRRTETEAEASSGDRKDSPNKSSKATTPSSSRPSDDSAVGEGSLAGSLTRAGEAGGLSRSFETTVTAKSIGSSTTLLASNKQQPLLQEDSEELPLPLLVNSTDSLSTGTPETTDSDGAVAAPPDESEEAEAAAALASSYGSKIVVDVLPPLPPTGPSSKPPPGAQSLKQRRRRRKKKKKKPKQQMTRVNSRDNLKEMETIAEAEESDDESDGEHGGSEYSWSTDGEDDSEASRSRDPSPVRSDSGAPSGESKPDGNAASPRSRSF